MDLTTWSYGRGERYERHPITVWMNFGFLFALAIWFIAESRTFGQTISFFALGMLYTCSGLYHLFVGHERLRYWDQCGIGSFTILLPYPFVYTEWWAPYWFSSLIVAFYCLKWYWNDGPSLQREVLFFAIATISFITVVVWGFPNIGLHWWYDSMAWFFYLVTAQFIFFQWHYATGRGCIASDLWGCAETNHLILKIPVSKMVYLWFAFPVV